MSTAADTWDAMAPVPVQVLSRREENHDTVTLEIESPWNGFSIEPGQFNMLYSFGIGEVPISLSGPSGEVETLVHSVRRVGAVTQALCDARAGSAIGVRGPFGKAWPVPAAEGHDLVIVAGGIGIAPLRPVVHHVFAHRQEFGHVSFLYGARSPRDLVFADELRDWRSRFDIDVEVTVDQHAEGWHGSVGVVTELLPRVSFDPAQALAFVCGPEVMMRFAARDLAAVGVAESSIYLTMERNMKCATAFCGHCQFGQYFICRDGPVFSFDRLASLMEVWEV
jgi:NAD(P)H-flavin reductase